jgi:hypothetical protein
MKATRHVAGKLLVSRYDVDFPEVYTLGSPSEAAVYAYFAYHVWKEIDGATQWLKDNNAKPRK